jgi:hypothetical protein
MRPSGPTRKVARRTPSNLFPMNDFIAQVPQAFSVPWSSSPRRGYGNSFFAAHFASFAGGSALTPRTSAPSRRNSGYRSRNPQASMVQPGVAARG